MKYFSELLDRLYFTYSHIEKKKLLLDYFNKTPDPDRGYALAIIAGALQFRYFKRGVIYEIITQEVDEVLFHLSYDYVGDLSETMSLIWPYPVIDNDKLPALHYVVEQLQHLDKSQIKLYVRSLLNHTNAKERWALVKMATGELRIGVSARFLKQVLAEFGGRDINEIEFIWHALSPPYENLFAWLEGKASKPNTSNTIYFHPVMLSHPLSEEELLQIDINEFLIEWKYDGIRVQVVSTPIGKALFSRTGDNISHSFPDVLDNINSFGVFDGELVIGYSQQIRSFNELQKRLNRKKPSKKLMQESPGHIILYDILMLGDKDLRQLSFTERRERLEKWLQLNPSTSFSLSPMMAAKNIEQLKNLRIDSNNHPFPNVEGIMLKRKNSIYIPGRPAGQWYKWKRDPFILDAVLMYAQRGQGKRSSYYSDYTFGLWQNGILLPIGKAYFGFTDEELYQLDKWIRQHTLQKFGPVREVEKQLVFEIAFEGIQMSTRHKSGFALRFPRINRVRWDKPAKESDNIEALKKLYLSTQEKGITANTKKKL
ncbi:MAG: cisplatin damage response ATP-dependent DNA ligase [Gammaproteobacteria bacterium]|nr:cisplatin damage response ATP-dependent DNA ligase [Gammaproteobacteria bacterium]